MRALVANPSSTILERKIFRCATSTRSIPHRFVGADNEPPVGNLWLAFLLAPLVELGKCLGTMS